MWGTERPVTSELSEKFGWVVSMGGGDSVEDSHGFGILAGADGRTEGWSGHFSGEIGAGSVVVVRIIAHAGRVLEEVPLGRIRLTGGRLCYAALRSGDNEKHQTE